MSNTSFYSNYPDGKVAANEINSTFNFEVIRDYCGSCYLMIDSKDEEVSQYAEYLYYLPKAIHVLVKNYHIELATEGDPTVSVDKVVKATQNSILRVLKDTPYKDLLMKVDLWKSEELLKNIYNEIFSNNNAFLGSLLKVAAKSIIESDYNRAKKYIRNNVSNPEMQKILDKSINGHEPDRIKFFSKEFNSILEEYGFNQRFMDSVGGTRFYYDNEGNEIGHRKLW